MAVKRSEKRGEPIVDPVTILESLQLLVSEGNEFPIKVEGTSTLPYATVIKELEVGSRTVLLKLVRPLPHELMAGAVFRAVLPVADQRFEGLITFLGREAYLQYRFQFPAELIHADRRHHPRFPFRPRENAYVTVMDATFPGFGVAGPLANLGLGGLALRVDRVIRLDTGLRIPPTTALFERGKSLPRIRIQDLPRLPIFECSARVAHTQERGSELLLGLDFGKLTEDEFRTLGDCLAFRQKLLQAVTLRTGTGSGSISSANPGAEARGHRLAAAPGEEVPEGSESSSKPEGADPLLKLQRRTTPLVLAMPPGKVRSEFLARIRRLGFLRLDVSQTLGELKASLAAGARPAILLLDMALAGGEAPKAAMQHLEAELEGFHEFPLCLLCEQVDPTLLLDAGGRTRLLPYEPEGEDLGPWIEMLDGLAGLTE